MPYGKLAQGANVWTAVSGIANSADENELQAQLAAMLKGLAVVAPLSAASYYSTGGVWDFRADVDPPYWERSGSHANPLYLPLGTIRKGQKLESVKVVVKGDNTGGSIVLYRNVISTSAAAAVSIGTAGTDPWNLSAAWTEHTISLTPEAATGAAYYLLFTTPTIGTMQILGAYSQMAFGDY